jgi:hypothetical protein
LIEHNRPRILAVDFSSRDVEKFRKLGYNVRRGATGLKDRDQFMIPWALHDVEIVFAVVNPGSFSMTGSRTPSETSVESEPNFRALFSEVWAKNGWVVFFIKPECDPAEVKAVGIQHTGVVSYGGLYLSPDGYLSRLGEIMRRHDPESDDYDTFSFPKFKGDAVVYNDNAPEATVLHRFQASANFIIFTNSDKVQVNWMNGKSFTVGLTGDESAVGNILALRLGEMITSQKNGVLLLPDFGDKNIDVAAALLQEVITLASPDLFDSPEHTWLKNYLPQPVKEIYARRDALIAETNSEVIRLNADAEATLENYSWLMGLLISKGDDFTSDAAQALRFLGFEVEEVDATLAPGQAKREDLRISDKATGYFAIGEAKTTKRGASEGFITDVQNHQGRYSREYQVAIPNAMLLVNHSLSLDPAHRAAHFYQNPDLDARCEAQGITAVDSAALFEACQAVLQGSVEKKQVREYVTQKFGVVRDLTKRS